ncbi:MAG TPA: hypothetical protein PK957_04090 [Candidatus Dojkabacteria bacterium]|nr:hypothetical protein [Candidatus Dojkabacteria bacterium]HQF36031.1 hypothetical protein [Candidatus Dojkabacteria bacterium]
MEPENKSFFKSDIYFGTSLYSQYPCIKYYWNKEDKTIAPKLKKITTYLQSQYKNILSEISIKNGEATIISHFPIFWEIGDKAIKQLIKKNSIKASETLKNNLKNIIGTASAIPILDAAIAKDYPITIQKIGKNYYKHFGYGKGSQYIQSTSSSVDSKFAKKFQNDKAITNEIAESLLIPVPKWKIVNTEKELIKAYSKFSKHDIVIKPYNLTRGVGVFVGIKNLKDAIDKFNNIKKLYELRGYDQNDQKILIQERVYGNDYRILCINGKLEIATLRTPAYVIGDGKLSIQELIEVENQNPARNENNLFRTLKPIIIDNTMLEMLEDQKITLQTIPTKGTVVPIRKTASVSQGGFTEDVTSKVNNTTRTMCELIAKQLNAFTLGIDIMCKDITKPLNNKNGYLIEVNTAPEMYLNIFPYKGRNQKEKGLTFLRALLPQKPKQRCYFCTYSNSDNIDTLLTKPTVRHYLTKSPICIINNNDVYEITTSHKTHSVTKINNGNIKQVYEFAKLNKRFELVIIITNDKKGLLNQKFNPILSEISL